MINQIKKRSQLVYPSSDIKYMQLSRPSTGMSERFLKKQTPTVTAATTKKIHVGMKCFHTSHP